MAEEVLEAWRAVFRQGIAPQLSARGLLALKSALKRDEPTLLQGACTDPPHLPATDLWPLEGGCPIVYSAWKADEVRSVGDAFGYFARVCHRCDLALGESCAWRWFLNRWDDTPREQARRELLEEVQRAIGCRLPLYLRREPLPEPATTNQGTAP